MRTLASRMKRARRLGGISGRTLDALSGVTAGYCALIENRRRTNIGVETIEPIAGVLGLSLDWLVSGKGDPPTEATVRAAIAAAMAKRESGKAA